MQLVLATLAGAGAVRTWLGVTSLVDVAPVTEGQQSTISVVYDPPMMVLAFVLGTAAGVLAVLGVAGLVRRRRVARHTP